MKRHRVQKQISSYEVKGASNWTCRICMMFFILNEIRRQAWKTDRLFSSCHSSYSATMVVVESQIRSTLFPVDGTLNRRLLLADQTISSISPSISRRAFAWCYCRVVYRDQCMDDIWRGSTWPVSREIRSLGNSVRTDRIFCPPTH